MPEQTKLFFWNNQNLFSNNYLEHHLPTTALWTEQRKKIKEEINQILTVEQQAKFEIFSYSYRQDLKKTLQTLIALQELDSKSKAQDLHSDRTLIK